MRKRTLSIGGGRWVTARRGTDGTLLDVVEHRNELEASAARFDRGEGYIVRFLPRVEPDPVDFPQVSLGVSKKVSAPKTKLSLNRLEKPAISEEEYMSAIESGQRLETDFRFVTYRVARSGQGVSKPAQFFVCDSLQEAQDMASRMTEESVRKDGSRAWRFDYKIQLNDARVMNGGARDNSGAKPGDPDEILTHRWAFHPNRAFKRAFDNFLEDASKETGKKLKPRRGIVLLFEEGLANPVHEQPVPEEESDRLRDKGIAVRLTQPQNSELLMLQKEGQTRQSLIHRILWSGLVNWYGKRGGEPDDKLRVRPE